MEGLTTLNILSSYRVLLCYTKQVTYVLLCRWPKVTMSLFWTNGYNTEMLIFPHINSQIFFKNRRLYTSFNILGNHGVTLLYIYVLHSYLLSVRTSYIRLKIQNSLRDSEYSQRILRSTNQVVSPRLLTSLSKEALWRRGHPDFPVSKKQMSFKEHHRRGRANQQMSVTIYQVSNYEWIQ